MERARLPAQMPIDSEADKASKEVKKAGKLLGYSKQFGLSGDEGNKRRETTFWMYGRARSAFAIFIF